MVSLTNLHGVAHFNRDVVSIDACISLPGGGALQYKARSAMLLESSWPSYGHEKGDLHARVFVYVLDGRTLCKVIVVVIATSFQFYYFMLVLITRLGGMVALAMLIVEMSITRSFRPSLMLFVVVSVDAP